MFHCSICYEIETFVFRFCLRLQMVHFLSIFYNSVEDMLPFRTLQPSQVEIVGILNCSAYFSFPSFDLYICHFAYMITQTDQRLTFS